MIILALFSFTKLFWESNEVEKLILLEFTVADMSFLPVYVHYLI